MKQYLFFLILILLHKNAINRSNLKAIPPCGGHPVSRASIKWDKWLGSICKISFKMCFYISASWIRIEPPPISCPFKTKPYACDRIFFSKRLFYRAAQHSRHEYLLILKVILHHLAWSEVLLSILALEYWIKFIRCEMKIFFKDFWVWFHI